MTEAAVFALAWGYAIAWILMLDQVKLRAYKILERRGEIAPEMRER